MELVGVGVIEADCYLEPAVEASKKIIQKFGSTNDKKFVLLLQIHDRFIRFQKSGVCMLLQ